MLHLPWSVIFCNWMLMREVSAVVVVDPGFVEGEVSAVKLFGFVWVVGFCK
jgi:hypothetical protein